jgi:hypothetical protein
VVEAGLRLAVATYTFWYERGFYSEGRAWFKELQAQAGGVATSAHAAALISAASLTELQGTSVPRWTCSVRAWPLRGNWGTQRALPVA